MTETEILEQKVKDLQEQLRQQEKMVALGMLSAGIAHEIQNPLNFVINFSKMSVKLIEDLCDIVDDVKENIDEDDAADLEDIAADLTANLNKIKEHGERAISIIRNILLQSRGKDGEFLPSNVCNIVHEYVWLSYHAMRANDKSFNISIHEEYDENIGNVMVVTQDICRAVLNLMNNACYTVKERAGKSDADYTPTITVSVKYEDGNIIIAIADNGMGMSDDIKNRIFREIITTKPVGQGTGLGLSITHYIVCEEHKGKLLVDSTEGEGTTFTIIIPAKKA